MQETKQPVEVRHRAQQNRSNKTRETILDTATQQFAIVGYEGVSIRGLELEAGVQRGAVAYHFDSKENLWKQVVKRIFEKFDAHMRPLELFLRDLDEDSQIQAVVSAFIRFNAEKPQLNRLIIQEGRESNWRLHYLLDNLIRIRIEKMNLLVGLIDDPHMYYMTVGAATLVFDVEEECRHLFGVDPTSEDFIQEHARRIAKMVITMKNLRATE